MNIEVTPEQITEAKSLVKNAEKELIRYRQILSNLEDKFAQQMCPHKIGDIVEVLGYAHKGKLMIINEITRPKWGFRGAQWRVKGNIINKNGTAGQLVADFEGGEVTE